MADEQAPCLLLTKVPPEIRQSIYEFASERKNGHLILKEYLEKIDPEIPPLAPITAATTTTIANDNEEDSDMGIEEEGEILSESDIESGDEEMEDEEESAEEDEAMDDTIAPQTTTTSASTATTATAMAANAPMQAAQILDEDDEPSSEDEDNSEEEDSEEEEDEGTLAPPPPPPARRLAPVIGRNTKYRHVLPIIQLSRCPPPIGLLLTCKQINDEAAAYHRNLCVLTINVNQGWSHFSMFLETLQKFIDDSYSPLPQIRKANIVVTWDSEWLREKTTGPSPEIDADQVFYFNYYLKERIQVVGNLLKKCTELRKVKVDWHDTEDTAVSRLLMTDSLASLHEVVADNFWFDETEDLSAGSVEIENVEHFSTAGTSHAKNSLLALRRTEFDHFVLSRFDMR